MCTIASSTNSHGVASPPTNARTTTAMPTGAKTNNNDLRNNRSEALRAEFISGRV